MIIPREARLINLSGRAEGPSGAKPRQFERKICIHRESFAFSAGSNFNCNVHQHSLDGNISAESFPFLPEIFFVKDCIEEITRFVAAVK